MADHAPHRRRLTGLTERFPELFPPRAVEPLSLETGRRLFAQEARFVAGAGDPGAMPATALPEVAFAGRSNVGKSSLVNALCGRRMLARTSRTPGRTRQVNLFAIGGRLMLADLPGYGFAAAARGDIERWTLLVRRYLQHRESLRRVCLLIDARHGLLAADRPVLRLLDEAGISYQAVLTKADKLRPAALAAVAQGVAAELAGHPAAHPEIHLTSADKRDGIAALRATLAALAGPASALPLAAAARPL